MPTDGDARDLQARRDVGRREPPTQQLEHLGLTTRQLDGRTTGNLHPPAQPACAKLVRQCTEQLPRDGRLAAPDRLERTADAGGAAGLEDVARCTGAQCVDQLVRVCPLDEQDDGRRRSTRLHERQRGDALPAFAPVDDAEVRPCARRSRGGGHAVGSLSRYDEPVRLEQRADPGADADCRRHDERPRRRPLRLVPGTGDGMGGDLV